jgi:hypothetical protein
VVKGYAYMSQVCLLVVLIAAVFASSGRASDRVDSWCGMFLQKPGMQSRESRPWYCCWHGALSGRRLWVALDYSGWRYSMHVVQQVLVCVLVACSSLQGATAALLVADRAGVCFVIAWWSQQHAAKVGCLTSWLLLSQFKLQACYLRLVPDQVSHIQEKKKYGYVASCARALWTPLSAQWHVGDLGRSGCSRVPAVVAAHTWLGLGYFCTSKLLHAHNARPSRPPCLWRHRGPL